MYLQILKLPLLFLFSIACLTVPAQTCTGSLGDPIVNITFGSGSSFGPPLPAGTTSDLQYMAATCPIDGFYSIVNYTSGCWSSDVVWHTAKDHTGNNNGYFMLINASYKPSNFYIQTIKGLCEGTTYQFSAWMLNMCSVTGILPNVTMTIEKEDGSILATYNTGDIPIINPVTWEQYAFYFTMPAGVSTVVLRMRNNAPGGVGNDVGLDDITFRPAGSAITTGIEGFTGDTVHLCASDSQDLHFTATVEACYSTTAYQWQLSNDNGTTWTDIPAAKTTTYTRHVTAPGMYLYRLLTASPANIGVSTCRVASTPLTVIVHAAIPLTLIKKSICEGDNYFGYTQTGTYTDSFKTIYGCDSMRTVELTTYSKVNTTIDTAICEGQTYSSYTVSGTYIDTLATVAGCDSVRTLHLAVHPTSTVNLDTTICYGGNVEGYTSSGTYNRVLKNKYGCDSTRTIHLTVIPALHPDLGPVSFYCTGDSLRLSPGIFPSYTWQNGSHDSSFMVTRPGKYSVTVANSCGIAIAEIVIAEQNCDIYFPTAFTPNGDGKNEVFKVLNAYNLTSFHLQIYNRWGQKVFETRDYTKGWDGQINRQPAPSGALVWFCEFMQPGSQNKKMRKGTVLVIR